MNKLHYNLQYKCIINNTKKFVEERKRQIMKHEREDENLTKSHEIQKTTLLAEIDKVFHLMK